MRTNTPKPGAKLLCLGKALRHTAVSFGRGLRRFMRNVCSFVTILGCAAAVMGLIYGAIVLCLFYWRVAGGPAAAALMICTVAIPLVAVSVGNNYRNCLNECRGASAPVHAE